ncbi:MAG: plasmid stabilization protein [Proteobacteria bacterium]|nr:plasmid stabilization protein [Pseudomonadota bacterium]
MSGKPLVPRQQANRDIDETLNGYLKEGRPEIAGAFIDVLQQTYAQIAAHPGAGSTHFADELNLPGLRCWPLQNHPQLVCYVEQARHIDVWRVLDGKRDIPAWLHEVTR